MPVEKFTAILDNHIGRYGVPAMVSLQGEGEPTLHADFFRMARLAAERGSRTYTITDGSYKHPEHFMGIFLDTLDEAEGRRIGRYNIPRVLSVIEELAPKLTVVAHSDALSAGARNVAAWCKARRLQHILQPLQAKDDCRCVKDTKSHEAIDAMKAQMPQGQ